LPITGSVSVTSIPQPVQTYITTSATVPVSITNASIGVTQVTTPWTVYISTSAQLPVTVSISAVTSYQGTVPWNVYISTSAQLPVSVSISAVTSYQGTVPWQDYIVTSVLLPIYIATSAVALAGGGGVSKTSFVVVGGSTITASGASSNYNATSYKDILVTIYIGSLSYTTTPALTIYFNAYDTYSGQSIPLASQAISSAGSYYLYVHDFPGTYFNISWVVQTSTVASNTYISVYEST
jgi:hypothetical protein